MNRYGNLKKLSDKNKKKNTFFFEDPIPTLKQLKRDYEGKSRRNYDNALRSRNLDRLLSYDEE